MHENFGNPPVPQEKNNEQERAEQKRKRIALAKELSEIHERIPFSGIDPEHYAKLKAEEEEYPGYATPIDELVERFRNEGMKVAFGRDPKSGNIFILPSGSEDIENDSILPQHLNLDGIMDGRLKELVLLSKDYIKKQQK
ncbi:MAG: hypothetical protein WC906_02190 [Parcubacteria group bacterium]|jgi:hypothetical protein